MPTLNQEDIKLAQRAINYLTDSRLKPDGKLGPTTSKAIVGFQYANQLDTTGLLDDDTWGLLEGTIGARFLRKMDFVKKAKEHNVPASMVLAVTDIESLGYGFSEAGKCVILFERHKFYQYAKQRYGNAQAEKWRAKYPNICHPVWDSSVYVGGDAEWDRYMQASSLDGLCAAFSASWGFYQIMGFNHRIAGYDDIAEFVDAMNISEHNHLDAFINFIKNQPSLWNAVKTRNYAAFARGYNGPAYAKNRYDVKLRDADMKYASYNQL